MVHHRRVEVGVAAALLLAALISVSSATTISSNEALFSFNGVKHRIQTLSPTLIRIEECIPECLSNDTNLVKGRDAFAGDPIVSTSNTSKGFEVETAHYTVLVAAAEQEEAKEAQSPEMSVSVSDTCKEVHVFKHMQPGNPIKRSAKYEQGTKATSMDDCCVKCDSDPTCTAFVYELSADKDGVHNCWPVASFGTPTAANDRIFASQLPPPPPPPPQMAITITSKTSGKLLWNGTGPHAVSIEPTYPTPADLYASEQPTVYAVRDGPRFVPPSWGITPAPNDYNGPFINTSGVDTRFADGKDMYFFVVTDAPQGTQELLKQYENFRSEFYKLTEPTPALPDWAFGFWFTWYHPYTQQEKTDEINRFFADKIPMSVASLDMDWRNLAYDYEYVVNTTLFPDMRGFFEFVHSKGLKFFFNDHPEPKGSQVHEPQPQMSPQEVSFRYNGLTSILDLGLDFWWFDWCVLVGDCVCVCVIV